ncbi:MAG: hypothetical protein Q9224_006969 [Gallowayella concinna]
MSNSDDEEGGEGVIGRKFLLCPFLKTLEMDELIKTCEKCDSFFVYCCSCKKRLNDKGRYNEAPVCHHFQLMFTDGACRDNGKSGATAGIGLAYGSKDEWQSSIPITAEMDPARSRTSQRAELLAVLAGLRFMVAVDKLHEPNTKETRMGMKRKGGKMCWVIATDSQYVVKGITEWLPTWKVSRLVALTFIAHLNTIYYHCIHCTDAGSVKNNNLRTNRNTKPANLDLFLQLDAEFTAQETALAVKIGFWHVPREYNKVADKLAKKAALLGDPE